MTIALNALVSPIATSGTPVEIRDEGVQKTAGVASIDFVGAGVTATNTGGAVTITVPSSSITKEVHKVAHGFTVGKAVAVDSSDHIWKCPPPAYSVVVGVVSKVIDADNFIVTTEGLVTGYTFSSYEDYLYPETSAGSLVVFSALTTQEKMTVVSGFLQPLVWSHYPGTSGTVIPYGGLAAPMIYRNYYYFEVAPHSTVDNRIELWYLDSTSTAIKAIATAEHTLASYYTKVSDSAENCFVLAGLGEASPDLLLYIYSGDTRVGTSSFETLTLGLTGTPGGRVYLSGTVAGGVTATPPAIRQVVGFFDSNGDARLCVPFREYVGGGSAVAVKDEGVSKTSAATSFDFVGSGVTVTNSGGDVTVDVNSQEVLQVHQVAHGFSVGDLAIYLFSLWTTIAGSRVGMGVITAVQGADDFTITFSGIVNSFSGLEPDVLYFPSVTVAGTLVRGDIPAPPAEMMARLVGDVVPFGLALTTTSLQIVPFEFSYADMNAESTVFYYNGADPSQKLLYLDRTVGAYFPASAADVSTLATAIPICYDIGNVQGLAVLMGEPFGRFDFAIYGGYCGDLTYLTLSGSPGDLVYLSATVPGDVTLTPPAIRQVVGFIDGTNSIVWITPYLETVVGVANEGTPLTPHVSSINFTGGGVTASNTGSAVTVDVPASITDHGGLAGLSDDDHPQYHTDARGDLRYAVQNGYENRTQSTISFVGATRVFSHTPVGTCYLWSNGVRYSKSGVETVTIANTEGLHFIYFDATGTLQETTTFLSTIITQHAFVAAIYYDVTNAVAVMLMDERHGREMDAVTHSYLHNTVGSRWGDGLGLTNITADGSGDLAAHAQVAVNGGSLWDEDIKHTIGAYALPAAIPFLYRLGATGAWRALASTGYVATTTGTGRAAWNRNNAGTWSLQEVTTNNYVLMHLIATGDILYPLRWVVGQSEYTTLANARAGADVEWSSLSLGGLAELSLEFVVCATLVINTATGYANAVKSKIRTLADGSLYVDWRKTQGSAAGGGAGVTDHSLLTNLAADDHPQYNVLVADEGVSKTTKANSMNFVGAGVTVTNTGDDVTVSIPGGSGGIATYIQNATPTITPGDKAFWIQTGLGDGTGMTFWVEDGL